MAVAGLSRLGKLVLREHAKPSHTAVDWHRLGDEPCTSLLCTLLDMPAFGWNYGRLSPTFSQAPFELTARTASTLEFSNNRTGMLTAADKRRMGCR